MFKKPLDGEEEMFGTLKNLDIWKDRKVQLLLALESLFVLLAIAGLFGKKQDAEIQSAPSVTGSWSFREDKGGWYIEEQDGTGELVFENISLKTGVYRVCLDYSTDTDFANSCTAEDYSVSYGGMLTNGTSLYAGRESTEYMMWLKEDTDALSVRVSYGGSGSLLARGLVIRGTNVMARIRLFWTVIFIIGINGAAAALAFERKRGISAERRNAALMLGLTVLAASLPLLTDYVIGGGDLVFHLMRIEGVKDGLLSGQFPVRIPPEWLHGHGYASSVFYGDTFLLIPAMCRLIGLTVQDSYKLFLVLLNAVTALVSYGCFRRILKHRCLGAFCSMLYTLSVYRIYVMYCRAALGEAEAMVFLPLLVYGFYRVYTEDCREQSYRSAWVPLTAGYCGLICSHILSCELLGGFSVLLCLVLWKKTFRKQTFKVLFQAVAVTCMISLWFIVPFLDYMLSGDYGLMHASARTIQDRGLYPAHLFFTFFRRGGNSVFGGQGMVATDPAGVGISLAAALMGFLVYVWTKRETEETRKLRRTGLAAAGIAILAMLFSLQAFPWDKLQGMNRIFAVLISSIQFPSRFLATATVALTLVAGILGALLWQEKDKLLRIGYCFVSIALVSVSGLYLIDDILYDSAYFKLYNEEAIGRGYIAAEEYLPTGTDTELLVYAAPARNNVSVEEWDKEYLHVTMTCSNSSGEEGYVEVPMLYYKGYKAYGENGRLEVCPGNNNLVRCRIPDGYSGTVEVEFASPWYWRAAELLSLATFCICLGTGIYRKKYGKEVWVRRHGK